MGMDVGLWNGNGCWVMEWKRMLGLCCSCIAQRATGIRCLSVSWMWIRSYPASWWRFWMDMCMDLHVVMKW